MIAEATEITEVTRASAREGRLQNPAVRAYIALAIGVVCIGFSAIFTKWADMPGAVSAFYRVAIALPVLTLPFLVQTVRNRSQVEESRRHMTWKVFWVTSLAGLFFALDLAFWNTSLSYTSAANSTLLGNTSTLWVSLGATLLFGESLKRRFWLGMALALVGAVVVIGPDLAHTEVGWGDGLAVGSSLFYAGYLLSTGKVRQHIGTLPFMWLSSLVATVFLLAYVLLTAQTLWGFTTDQWLALAALALISHVLGWLAINYSLGHLPAPLTAVTLLSQPVITAILAVWLLNEPLSVYQIGGGLLVLFGIYIVNSKRSSENKGDPA